MITKTYITSLLAVTMGIFFIPDLETAVRVYLISVVTFVTTIINLLFKIEKLRQWIVQKIVADVMAELFKHKEMRELLTKKESNERRTE